MAPRNADPRRAQFKRGLARAFRANPTDAERRLWYLLRCKKFGGLKFRRQQPMGPYVVDFFCPAAKLVIELDGGQHSVDTNAAYDAARTRWLEARGYKVVRIPNHEILKGKSTNLISSAVAAHLPLPKRPLAVRPSLKGRVG